MDELKTIEEIIKQKKQTLENTETKKKKGLRRVMGFGWGCTGLFAIGMLPLGGLFALGACNSWLEYDKAKMDVKLLNKQIKDYEILKNDFECSEKTTCGFDDFDGGPNFEKLEVEVPAYNEEQWEKVEQQKVEYEKSIHKYEEGYDLSDSN